MFCWWILTLFLVYETAAQNPPAITPRPHVIVTLNGTFTTPATITIDCSQVYSDDFSASLKDIVSRTSDAISRGELCVGIPVNVIQGDTQLVVQGQGAKITFTVMVFPTESNTIRGVEVCSYDVQVFVQNYNNWRQPIIYGYGCPTVSFTPQAFDHQKSEWSCFD